MTGSSTIPGGCWQFLNHPHTRVPCEDHYLSPSKPKHQFVVGSPSHSKGLQLGGPACCNSFENISLLLRVRQLPKCCNFSIAKVPDRNEPLHPWYLKQNILYAMDWFAMAVIGRNLEKHTPPRRGTPKTVDGCKMELYIPDGFQRPKMRMYLED